MKRVVDKLYLLIMEIYMAVMIPPSEAELNQIKELFKRRVKNV